MPETRCPRNPGCVKPARHKGNCRLADSSVARISKPGRSRPGCIRRPSFSAILNRAARVGQEVLGLIADCELAIDGQGKALEIVDARNRELLKQLVKSRRQIQKMAAGLSEKAGGDS